MGLDWASIVNPIIDFGGTPELPDALGTIPLWNQALAGALFSLNILVADLIFVRLILLHSYTTLTVY